MANKIQRYYILYLYQLNGLTALLSLMNKKYLLPLNQLQFLDWTRPAEHFKSED